MESFNDFLCLCRGIYSAFSRGTCSDEILAMVYEVALSSMPYGMCGRPVENSAIDLLERVVNEIDEKKRTGKPLNPSIADDLLSRLYVIMEAVCDKPLYKKNLPGRNLLIEDLFIISAENLTELSPLLIKAFYSQKTINFEIILTLSSLKKGSPEIIDFFDSVVRGDFPVELKCAALAGLKKSAGREHWLRIKEAERSIFSLADYIEKFDPGRIEKNELPYDQFSLLYVSLELRQSAALLGLNAFLWINSFCNEIGKFDFSEGTSRIISYCVYSILLSLDARQFSLIGGNSELLKSLVMIIDKLPGKYLNRIIEKTGRFTECFTEPLSELIFREELKIDMLSSPLRNFAAAAFFRSTRNL